MQTHFTSVIIQAPEGYSFKGLILQAYDPNTNQPIGSFSSGRGLKTIDSCSAVTHTDRKGLSLIKFSMKIIFTNICSL